MFLIFIVLFVGEHPIHGIAQMRGLIPGGMPVDKIQLLFGAVRER